MEYEDFIKRFVESYKSRSFIVFCAECTVNYSGRTETFLDKGERIILLKPDYSIQVHQPFGNTAINYMKENTDHTLSYINKNLILKSYNIPLGEFMEINISNVHFFNSHKAEDIHKLKITGDESDMSDMIYNNPTLIEKGLKSVSQEEQTKYGFIDVLCTDENNNLVVIECKRVKADFSAVTQLYRYVNKICENKGITTARGILVAPSITYNAQKMLEDYGYKFISIDPPKYLEKLKKSQKNLGEF